MLTKTPIWPEPPPRHARSSAYGRSGTDQRVRRRRLIDVLALVAVVVAATGCAYVFGLFEPAAEVVGPASAVGGAPAAEGEGASAPEGGGTDPQGPAGTDEQARNAAGTGSVDVGIGAPDAVPGEAGPGAAPGALGTDPTAAGDPSASAAPDATAGTCPEADQVWSAENGNLDPSELASIPFAPDHSVRADVVDGLVALNDAYVAQFGVDMVITSAYRSYAEQEALYDPASPTAAPPGCSNHGTGLAVDIGGGVEDFESEQYAWLKANAEAHGWVHPPFAEPSGRNPEPWHWQSVQAPNSY